MEPSTKSAPERRRLCNGGLAEIEQALAAHGVHLPRGVVRLEREHAVELGEAGLARREPAGDHAQKTPMPSWVERVDEEQQGPRSLPK